MATLVVYEQDGLRQMERAKEQRERDREIVMEKEGRGRKVRERTGNSGLLLYSNAFDLS